MSNKHSYVQYDGKSYPERFAKNITYSNGFCQVTKMPDTIVRHNCSVENPRYPSYSKNQNYSSNPFYK
jgi:hypothetical protein